MGIAALEGYEGSNGRTMDLWEKVSSLRPQPLHRGSHAQLQAPSADLPRRISRHRLDRHVHDPPLLRRLCRQPGTRKEVERSAARFRRPDQVHPDGQGGVWKSRRRPENEYVLELADPAVDAKRTIQPDCRFHSTPVEVVVFSDALDVDRCIELKQAADEAGIGASFGVGTNLTNGALAFDLASLLPAQLT